ncbi:hypothetical protein ACWGH5_38280 [Streptomyces sp. NPDC054864]
MVKKKETGKMGVAMAKRGNDTNQHWQIMELGQDQIWGSYVRLRNVANKQCLTHKPVDSEDRDTRLTTAACDRSDSQRFGYKPRFPDGNGGLTDPAPLLLTTPNGPRSSSQEMYCVNAYDPKRERIQAGTWLMEGSCAPQGPAYLQSDWELTSVPD